MRLNRIVFFSIALLMLSCSQEKPESREAKEFKKDTHAIQGDTVTEVGLSVRCIIQDAKNNLWIGTDGEGVFKYNGKTIIRYRDKQGLCSNYIWTITEAKDGTIWFKTRDAICFYNGHVFNAVKLANPGPSVYKPGLHDLIGNHYYDGANIFKIELPHTSPLKNTSGQHYDIYSSFLDSKGNAWFGTASAGVCRYDGKTYTWLGNPELGAPVRTIFEDSKGNIWIGNNGYGLFRYDGNKLTNLTKEHKLENPAFLKSNESKDGTMARVYAIGEDTEGKIWIGTIDTNIWMYDGKSIINYTNKGRLDSDAIWSIYRDKNNVLWFGTDGGGLYKLKGKSFMKLKVRRNLKS